MTNFKYNEENLLAEFSKYVDGTYSEHYVGEDNVQSLDIIFSSGNGIGFTVGNVQKYSARYGKKKGYNRDDLMKAMHYCLLALYRHDIEHARAEKKTLEPKSSFLTENLPSSKGFKYWYIVDKVTGKKVPDTYCFKNYTEAAGYHHSMRKDTAIQLRTPDDE
jgi:hypothetical protein